jgi:hypothetical protein
MKSALWICLLFVLAVPALAQMQDSTGVVADTTQVQPRTTWNNAYVEVDGNALVGSFNYERMLSESVCFRVGFLTLPSFLWGAQSFDAIFCLGLNFLVGSEEYKFG